MDVKRQQGGADQGDLFDEALKAALRHGANGEGGTGPGAAEEPQASAAWDHERALTRQLMEEVTGSANLNRAYKRVKANGGAAGVDGMSVTELRAWIAINRETLIASLLDGSYQPQPVRGVQIPKPGGGMRQLGIPTVVDRLVQQAITQALEPLLDPTFSELSFGFRPGRSAHDALRQARGYVADGRVIVVDLDLEKFFDRVNHDILMSRLARRIGDKRLLRIVRRFLQAGMHGGGGVQRTARRHAARRSDVAAAGQSAVGRPGQGVGTPGAPLLPVRGRLQHLRAAASGGRAGDGVGDVVPGRPAAAQGQPAEERGCPVGNVSSSAIVWDAAAHLASGAKVWPAPRIACARSPVATGDCSLERMVEQVNGFVTGWVTYYRHARCESTLRDLDGWLRRKLRCVKLKRCKHVRTMVRFLIGNGVTRGNALKLASSGKGWWRKTNSQQAKQAMPVAWFDALGLVRMANHHATLNPVGNRRGT